MVSPPLPIPPLPTPPLRMSLSRMLPSPLPFLFVYARWQSYGKSPSVCVMGCVKVPPSKVSCPVKVCVTVCVTACVTV
jgi:hypothetical protein